MAVLNYQPINEKLGLHELFQCYAYFGLIEGPANREQKEYSLQSVKTYIFGPVWGAEGRELRVHLPNLYPEYENTHRERLNICRVEARSYAETTVAHVLFYDYWGADIVASLNKLFSEHLDYDALKVEFDY